MCRWLAYSGAPVLLEDLLYRPEHSLIVQSMHSTLGAEATNGDGFGVGWYGDGDVHGVFRSIEPAWNDRNLSEVAAHGGLRGAWREVPESNSIIVRGGDLEMSPFEPKLAASVR